MPIDVEALWEQSGHWLTDYTAAVIEECALEAEECKNEMLKDIYNDACSDCAAAIRALKP